MAAAQRPAGAVRRGSREGDDGDQCCAAERPECLGERPIFLTSLNRKMLGTCHGRRLGQTMMIDVSMIMYIYIYIPTVLRRLKTKKLFVRNADGSCQENIPQYYLNFRSEELLLAKIV